MINTFEILRNLQTVKVNIDSLNINTDLFGWLVGYNIYSWTILYLQLTMHVYGQDSASGLNTWKHREYKWIDSQLPPVVHH